jgi:hypothetical protein
MMRKSRVLEAGNYQGSYLLEDYDLFVRMLQKGCIGCTVKEYLISVRINDGFYRRRGGFRYVKTLIQFNRKLFRCGWMSWKDYIVRSAANIAVGMAPGHLRSWIYRHLLRKKPGLRRERGMTGVNDSDTA